MKQEHTFAIHIEVENISSCSGIFIGPQNIAMGWSSHSKSNFGFGSLDSNNHVLYNTTMLYDPDVIDTPIDDRDVHVLTQSHSMPQANAFNLQHIQAEVVQQNGGIFVGEANMTGWDTHEKQNYGIGHIYGDGNVDAKNVNLVMDGDTIDAPIQDQDFKAGIFRRLL